MFDCTGKGSYRSCIEKSYDDITLVAGEQNTVVANAAHEQKLYIEEVTIHENYNSGKVANHNSLNNGLYDIAVIKLKEAVEWTDWVKPVCLPGTRKLNLTEGASGYIAGKVQSLLEACLDLISSPSPSMKIQTMGGKITENLGLES